VSVNDANTIVHISNLWSGAQYFFSNDYTRTATTPALIQGPYTAPGGNYGVDRESAGCRGTRPRRQSESRVFCHHSNGDVNQSLTVNYAVSGGPPPRRDRSTCR